LESGPDQDLVVGEHHLDRVADRGATGWRNGRRAHRAAVVDAARGSRASTSNPPHGRGPAANSPPNSPQRSRMPTIPRPGPTGPSLTVSAGGNTVSAGGRAPPSSVTRTRTASVP